MLTCKISTNYEVIRDMFSKDSILLNKWHINSEYGPESCINRTIEEVKTFKNFQFFEVHLADKLIGFFGIEGDNFLSTLFLLPEYRTSKYINFFWQMITSRLKNEFYSAMYAKNIPCINFFLKNNAQIVRETVFKDNKAIIFSFQNNRGDNLCH